MPSIMHEVEVRRPIGVVFASVADFGNDPKWRADLLKMRPLGATTTPGGQ